MEVDRNDIRLFIEAVAGGNEHIGASILQYIMNKCSLIETWLYFVNWLWIISIPVCEGLAPVVNNIRFACFYIPSPRSPLVEPVSAHCCTAFSSRWDCKLAWRTQCPSHYPIGVTAGVLCMTTRSHSQPIQQDLLVQIYVPVNRGWTGTFLKRVLSLSRKQD